MNRKSARHSVVGVALFGAILVAPMAAQTITVTPTACVPLEPFHDESNHAVVSATVGELPANSEVRLYYRRMHHIVEDFYYTIMQTDSQDNYWGVLPDPEDREPERFDLDNDHEYYDDDEHDEYNDTDWADWWKAKEASIDRDPNNSFDDDEIREKASVGSAEPRTWMTALSNEDLQEWLEELENNPAEYFVAAYSPNGLRSVRSDMFVAIVEPDQDQCHIESTPQQLGEQANMTVAESSTWQYGKPPFQWECTGIVTRLDQEGIKRGDESCRACVVAMLPGWVPVAGAAAAVVAGEVVEDPIISPSEP